jgi:segregation and condensation protein A
LVAATLIQIKSRMLLPRDPEAGSGEQEDPRRDLVDKLLEHERFKSAAEMLESKRALEDGMWTQSGTSELQPAEEQEIAPNVASVFDIIRVFSGLLERAKKQPDIQIRREPVTVAQMSEHIKQVLMGRVDPVPLEDLVAGYVERQMLIALLLALLEMMRLREVVLRQEELFGALMVGRGERFAEILSDNEAK